MGLNGNNSSDNLAQVQLCLRLIEGGAGTNARLRQKGGGVSNPTKKFRDKSFQVLNTRLSAEDNVISAANKARRMLFYLKRYFGTLTTSIFLRLYKAFIRPHLEYAI